MKKLTCKDFENAFYKLCREWCSDPDTIEEYQVFAGIDTESYDISKKEVKKKFIVKLYLKLWKEYKMPKKEDFILLFNSEYEYFKRDIKEQLNECEDPWH